LIDKSEIMDFSREFGLTANVIEKDYVLGWVFTGIFNHAEIGANWFLMAYVLSKTQDRRIII